MRHLKFIFKIFSSLFILGTLGCREDFSDNEIRGVLSVDKAQYGNSMLEVNSENAAMIRFIYPGRKIIKISQGLLSTKINIYESGMANLSQIELPTKLLKATDDKSFFIEGRNINQAWNIKAERILKVIRTDYVNRASSNTCRVENQEGVVGSVWEVIDSRYDYVIHFINEVTG